MVLFYLHYRYIIYLFLFYAFFQISNLKVIYRAAVPSFGV